MPSKRTRPPDDPRGAGHGSALLVDLYELTMLQSYLEHGMHGQATFAVWVRNLPPDWGFLVAAGWPRVADFAAGLRFDAADLGYLRSTGLFSEECLDALGRLRFAGNIRALPEGLPF